MKKLVLTLIIIATTLTANASKSPGTPFAVKQPDGTTLMVRLLGDEYFSWYQTLDGILLKPAGKAFYIAKIDEKGELLNSGILAHNLDVRKNNEREVVAKQEKRRFFAAAQEEANDRRKTITGFPYPGLCPHTGKIKVPVILMEFAETDTSNVKFTFDREVLNNYFNSTTKTPYTSETRFDGYGSVAQYFRDASNGQLEFEFDLYGPYTTEKGHDYYGHHNNDPSKNGQRDLLKEAIKAADADIAFQDYDSDGDRVVDLVYILYAGTGANIGGNENDFWPSCYYNESMSTDDGWTIRVIGGANELAAYSDGQAIRAGIGVTCHEISHGLGLPDLYYTQHNKVIPKDAEGYTDYNNCGPEDWDLMDGGENLYNAMWPCQYTAWEREILGWIEAEELTEPSTITVYPLDTDKGKAYRVTNPAQPLEYYIIENYQNKGWNYYIAAKYGSGLMITHVNGLKLSMTPNLTYGKPNVTILPADGFILASYSEGETMQYKGEVVEMPTGSDFKKEYFIPDLQGDPYPGLQNVTSVAAYKNYAGEEMVDQFPITNIVKNADGSITFDFMGGEGTGIKNVAENAKTDSRVYTIDGRAVSADALNGQHGIFIKNGKKFIR